jgi:Transglutaminase-like superfamily
MGILKSGDNGICTANANLAAALMRSKGIACRSMAVVPTISRRLEMHRIVEFRDNGSWVPFDPSSLRTEIPTRPWHNVIMAKTTIEEEQTAMRPPMGAMAGCPCGQEIELLTSGVNLFGQGMFWTMARPLAEFEPTEEATRLASKEWARYLETGTLTRGQLDVYTTRNAAQFVKLLNKRTSE